MKNRANTPKVNAGSMADIAFLLLIFFLVTTSIETDVGLERMLPKLEENAPIADVYERNILRILIDDNGQLLVEDSPLELLDLRKITIDFLDNGGVSSGKPGHCTYCMGIGDAESSDYPSKAIISLSTLRQTEYGAYIAVQNELVAAYNTLRNREAQRLFNKDYTTMEKELDDVNMPLLEKEEIKGKILALRSLFPMKITELETIN